MSNFEIALIVCLCAIPFVSLVFVLPKIKGKKEKKSKEAKPTQAYTEIKKEENKEAKPEPLKIDSNNEVSSKDFKNFMTSRSKSMTKPSRVDLPDDFLDRTMPYSAIARSKRKKKTQTVAEELRSLSPQLKALIITGALDKKNFD